jgi:hypothetical protein
MCGNVTECAEVVHGPSDFFEELTRMDLTPRVLRDFLAPLVRL